MFISLKALVLAFKLMKGMVIFMLSNDIKIVKNLAGKYAEISNKDENLKKALLHRGVNDLKMERPVVLMDEIPWNELKNEAGLVLECQDERFREIENYFRQELYRYENFCCDRVFTPFFPVRKVIYSTGFGISVEESTISADNGVISSHRYVDKLQTEEDLEKLTVPKITYDKEKTDENFSFASGVLNNILPVKIVGIESGHGTGHRVWDDVSMLKGVTNLLIDLAERPEFMHKLAEKLTNIEIETAKQYEELGLLEYNLYYLHCTAGATNDLTPPEDHENVKLKNIWGRGVAQIFASVSPVMHEEFEIYYAKKVLESHGLVYYGCCEPLDRKIDIVRQIKNLRKISITPWANINIAAEAIGKDYVVAVKPNPATLSLKNLDEKAVRDEITNLYNACYKNSCSFEFTLKDISSSGGNPKNLSKWAEIAMSIVK